MCSRITTVFTGVFDVHGFFRTSLVAGVLKTAQMVYNGGSSRWTESPGGFSLNCLLHDPSFAIGFTAVIAFFIPIWSYFSMATAPKTPRKKKAVKEVDPNAPPAPPKVKRTRKVAAEPRIKLYWGVFNQNLKRVAVFEYVSVNVEKSRERSTSCQPAPCVSFVGAPPARGTR